MDFSAQELLKKAGCDGIVCTSRFDAHFLSHELLNPGVQEVVEELTSNLRGQKVYLTRYTGSRTQAYASWSKAAKPADTCRSACAVANASSSTWAPSSWSKKATA